MNIRPSFRSIYLNDECAHQNAHMDGDQNSDIWYGQLCYNVDISQYVMYKEQEQVNMNSHE